jgi:N-acetylmuramoyl-L-alanine amidase
MAKRVFIGVGHGGSDPGAVGFVREEDANLTIALELKRLLEGAGVVVGISRLKDENDTLSEEIREANAFRPDFAIDVHNNAGGGDGFEVFVQTGVHATQSKKAGQLLDRYVKAMHQNSRGVKTKLNDAGKDYFGFLRQVNYPAVIVEGFFVDNKKDAADFDTATEQKKMAAAYAAAILEFLGVENTPPPSPALFRVQVGAFANRANAERLSKELMAKGYPAYIVKG